MAERASVDFTWLWAVFVMWLAPCYSHMLYKRAISTGGVESVFGGDWEKYVGLPRLPVSFISWVYLGWFGVLVEMICARNVLWAVSHEGNLLLTTA
jgi:hypothetical protein